MTSRVGQSPKVAGVIHRCCGHMRRDGLDNGERQDQSGMGEREDCAVDQRHGETRSAQDEPGRHRQPD